MTTRMVTPSPIWLGVTASSESQIGEGVGGHKGVGRGAEDQKKGVGGTMDTVGMLKRPGESMSNAPMRRRYTLFPLVWHTPFVAACRFQLHLRARLIVWGRCVHFMKNWCI